MRIFAFVLAASSLLVTTASADDWPQFRGPKANGWVAGNQKLPEQVGPDKNVLWKVPLPPGHSSPVVHGKKLFVTGVRDKQLVVLAMDAETGKVLWEEKAPHKSLEKIHLIGSHAQPTPATDGEVVISMFGSNGLFGHDASGKQLWHMPLGPFKNDFGAGASPILAGDWVILNQDHDTDSFLMAIHKKTGKQVWKTDRSEFPRSYATPVIWEVDGKKQIVVPGTLRLVGYDFETGKELWTVRGLARISNMTPAVGADGILYLAAWSPGADENDRIEAPPWKETIAANDKNKNGTLEVNEITDPAMKQRFTQIDRDKDDHISQVEYEGMRKIFADAQNVIMAIKPGGKGDITKSHVLWTQKRTIPYIPSPLVHAGHLFLVKDGGILNCLDAKTGKPTKQERVFGQSSYYSSPVGGDSKIYLISQKGDLTVISAEGDWKILHKARFEEECYATPAIAGGRIYLRTAGHLYCFGEKK